ncbi:MAG: phosphoribosyltransferase [Cyclobacteriaceae bacterium]|jgi:pyrimidine operon attenuation protein / uracil phosphoribosyltransferase|nr:phosphoribosyltransferase [Cyclobacteriaceae bacterium]
MSVDTARELVLDSEKVTQKIKRIAYEIYENNFKEKSIILAGIDGQGYSFAKLLAAELEGISPLHIKVVKVSLDKLAPQQSEVILDIESKELKRKCIILADDVLNSGRTLAYGMKPFLITDIKKIEVAVLVNRSHTLFPITPTYTGYRLTTTLNDHVEVVLGKKSAVYLH